MAIDSLVQRSVALSVRAQWFFSSEIDQLFFSSEISGSLVQRLVVLLSRDQLFFCPEVSGSLVQRSMVL